MTAPTAPQLSYIKDLADKKGATFTPPTTKDDASKVIDWLKSLKTPTAAPSSTVKVAAAPLTAGIYLAPNGDVIQLKTSKTSGNLYAKVAMAGPDRLNLHGEVVKFKFVYAPGLVRHILPQMKMSIEQAEEFSIKFSQCMSCGRTLKAADSVKKGIGPVCAKMFG